MRKQAGVVEVGCGGLPVFLGRAPEADWRRRETTRWMKAVCEAALGASTWIMDIERENGTTQHSSWRGLYGNAVMMTGPETVTLPCHYLINRSRKSGAENSNIYIAEFISLFRAKNYPNN